MCLHKLNGALLVNKPAGVTSAEVIRQLKRKFRPTKIGHAGTLDPDATGLLIVLLGKATRLQSLVMDSSKTYCGTIRLGIATDTDDISGEVIETKPLPDLEDDQLLLSVEQYFCGTISQRPPAYSAIKVAGRRSYELARKGQIEGLAEREILINRIELKPLARDQLQYLVEVSKGTYVRALARDIGERLNSCACASEICRVASGEFNLESAVSLKALLESKDLLEHLVPMAKLVSGLPSVFLNELDSARLKQGDKSGLSYLETVDKTAEIAVFGFDQRFLGVLSLNKGSKSAFRLLS